MTRIEKLASLNTGRYVSLIYRDLIIFITKHFPKRMQSSSVHDLCIFGKLLTLNGCKCTIHMLSTNSRVPPYALIKKEDMCIATTPNMPLKNGLRSMLKATSKIVPIEILST